MLNLNDLRLFARVVEHRGFAAAGRALGLPKSTLSKRVGELERRLGVRLIQRSSRGFAVTELGRELQQRAAAMLIEAEAAEALIEGRRAEPSGTVRLTASVPAAQFWLAESLPALALAHPKIRLVLHVTDRFVDLVQEGYDLALRSHFGPLPDSGLVQRRLGEQPIHLLAAPGYLARRGTPETPAALTAHDGLLTGPAETAWRLRGPAGESATVTPRPRLVADETEVLLRAAAAGLGVTCLPAGLCRAALAAGSLVRLLPGWTAGSVTTSLLVPHRRGQLPSVRAVADFLVAHFDSAA